MKYLFKNILHYFLMIILFFPFSAECQEIAVSEVLTDIAEELAANETDPEGASLLTEQLYELYEKPVTINSGTISEISRLFFLSDFQIKSLTDYIQTTGKIVSLYEIAAIPGFDRSVAEMISPFISFGLIADNIPDSLKWNNTLLTNLIVNPGERDTSLSGSSLKFLTKYRLRAGPFEGGFTIEKDPGEKFFTGSPPLPDFFSAHASYSGKGVVKKIIVGDFSSRFGQGTNINTGIRTGLSLTSPGYMSARNEIRPYTSTDENNYFRGVAAEFSLRKFDLSIFCSYNKIDATPALRPDSSYTYIENLYRTGLHTTSSQILKKDILSETASGFNFSCNLTSMKIGMTWSAIMFSIPILAEVTDPENLYDFNNRKNNIFSLYYNSLISRILLYGEISLNNMDNFAVVQGATLRPSDRLSINVLYRDYAREFISFHGNGPGNSSHNNNERGILGNFTFEAAKHLFISAGCDLCYYPWLRYRCSFPSMGKRYEIRIQYLPSEKITCDFLYSYRHAMFDDQADQGISGIAETISRTIRGSVKYTLNNCLTMATRLDYKVVDPSGNKGMLMMQDIIYRFHQLPLTFWFRYCIFNTDDWDTRLYTYENDLLYNFSIPALSGEGSRSYLMIKWKIGKFSELRIKYGLTTLLRNTDITEDKDELKLQLRLWF
jgi:hypothetical protein